MDKQYTEQELIRREKLMKIKDLGFDPYGAKYEVTHSFMLVRELVKDKTHEELEALDIQVSTAGRILTIRDQGKVAFVTLKDRDSTIQLYIRKDMLTEKEWELFKLLDLGDIIGVKGRAMLTRTLEPTIRVVSLTILSKALRPLPEKFHGLVDPDERYRKKYLDLITNDEAKKIALLRPKIIRAIQNLLDSKGYVEIETSILQSINNGASARPFVTHLNALDINYYLRIALEISLKKMLVGGLEKVYEIGRVFRNEGMDTRHNPEFTMLELYEAYSDLNGMMDLTEEIFRQASLDAIGTTIFTENEHTIDLAKPFRKVDMLDLIKEYAKVDLKKQLTLKQLQALAKKHDITVENHYKEGHIINAFFEKYCEDKLIEPTIVYGHPIDITPLAKKSSDPRFAYRFELFIFGREFANAYSELNDPIDQESRLLAQLEEKRQGNAEASDLDNDFIDALEYGMPPAGGLGIGIDRLVMLLTGVTSITEVLLFPLLKPKK